MARTFKSLHAKPFEMTYHVFSGFLSPSSVSLAEEWSTKGIILMQELGYVKLGIPKHLNFTLEMARDILYEYGNKIKYLGKMDRLFIVPLGHSVIE